MKRWVKRLGYAVAGAVGLVMVLVAGVYGFSAERLAHKFPVATESLAIPTDMAAVARGRHLVEAVTKCGTCHAPDMGGQMFLDAGPMVGTVYAPNVTTGRGSVTTTFTAADWERAIRHGLAPDGRALKIMPSEDFIHLSDADLAAILAYVRSLPPVDRVTGTIVVGPLGRALYLAGKFPILSAERLAAMTVHPTVTAGVTKEYGEYLANIGGCTGCHGPGLSGGRIPGTPPSLPPSQNLTSAGIGQWTEADFFRALRQGKRPDGTTINPFMPWVDAGKMTDDEIRAVWLYLRSVPARASGQM